MKIHYLKSETVCHDSEHFLFIIGHKHYNIGFQWQYGMFRLMVIWWHVCIRFNYK